MFPHAVLFLTMSNQSHAVLFPTWSNQSHAIRDIFASGPSATWSYHTAENASGMSYFSLIRRYHNLHSIMSHYVNNLSASTNPNITFFR